MTVIYSLFQIFLSVLLFYASFVSIYINFSKKQFDFLSLFFSLSLCALCFLLFYHIYKSIKRSAFKKELTKKLNKKSLWLLSLCFLSLLIGFFNVQSQYPRGLHIAESGQFGMAYHNITIEGASTQQQPPLDYYFSAFSSQLFHTSKFSARFHTMLFYLLICLILPLGLYYYSSFLISALGSLLFLINHVIRLHAVDGRPLNLALLTGFLFLFFYINFFNSKQKQPLIPILCSQYLFTLSIGLQPIVFSMTLFLSSFWLFLYSQKEIFKKLFLSHTITALLSFPFYLKMLLYAKSAEKFKDFSSSSIIHHLSEWKWPVFIQKYFFTFYDQMFLSFLFPILGWLFLTVTKQKADKKILILFSSAVIFPLLFDALWLISIRYHSNSWYFIVFSLFLIFLFVFTCQFLNSYLKQNKSYYFILIPFLVLFAGSAYSQAIKIKNKTRFYFPYLDNSVEEVYDYLKEKESSGDFILELKLIPILKNGFLNEIYQEKLFFYEPRFHPIFIKKRIIYTNKPPFFYERNHFNTYYIDKTHYKKNKNQKIFFTITRPGIHDDISEQALSQLLPKKTIGRFAVFEFTLSSKNKEQEYIRFLQKIKDKTPKRYQASLLETLLYYSYKQQKKIEFNKLLEEYKKIRSHLPKYTKNPDLKYPIHFDHKRRVTYFEGLNWN